MTPSIYKEENFELIDYSQRLAGVTDIAEVSELIENFLPSDIRLLSRPDYMHWYVTVILCELLLGEISEKVLMVIEYNEEGFRLVFGGIKTINMLLTEGSRLQKVHFSSRKHCTTEGIHEIIEWTYLHKDEAYADAEETPELNMGKRVFEFIMSLLNSTSVKEIV